MDIVHIVFCIVLGLIAILNIIAAIINYKISRVLVDINKEIIRIQKGLR